MSFKYFDLNDILSDMSEKVADVKLEKKAHVLPEGALFQESNYSEIDFYDELRKQAAADFADILDDAHPEGAHKLDGLKDMGDGAIVEDLKSRHEKMVKSVETEAKVKVASVVEKLEGFAAELSKGGHADLAKSLLAKTAELKSIL